MKGLTKQEAEILRKVGGVSTKAYYKLRFIITKAKAIKAFKDKLWYEEEANSLLNMFLFDETPEDVAYWASISLMIDFME